MKKMKKYAAGGAMSPDDIVADIDRKQIAEDLDLLPRAGRMIKDKVKEDLTGGAYVGSRLNMPSNTRMGKLSPSDTKLLNEYDASPEGKTAKMERRYGIPSSTKDNRMGMKKGGSVSSASKRADGCAVKGKTKGRMI
jgi:hypothetical protein